MKQYLPRVLLCSVLSCALATIGAAQGRRGRRGAPPAGAPPQAGLYTTMSGTIAQLNYDPDGNVAGFLLNNNTLVNLPPRAAPYVGTSVRRGDNVQIAGYAQTSPAGVQTIDAQSIQDRTFGKSFTIPQPGAAAPYSGSGRIQQLNYARDGAINGFLLDNGTLAAVPPFAATNPSSIRVGSIVAFTGYARNTISGRTVVNVQSLSINGQPLTLGMAGPVGGPGAPPPPPVGPQAGPGTLPPAPAAVGPAPPAPPATPLPAGRTNEPPPPPPPPQR